MYELAPPYTWSDKKNWDKVTALDGLGDLRLLMSEVGGGGCSLLTLSLKSTPVSKSDCENDITALST